VGFVVNEAALGKLTAFFSDTIKQVLCSLQLVKVISYLIVFQEYLFYLSQTLPNLEMFCKDTVKQFSMPIPQN